jgi:myosin heavy chain 9/10/11/14
LEEQRDRYMQKLFTAFQSVIRGYMQRRLAKKRLFRHEAVGIIQQNLLAYNKLQSDPWWRLYTKMRPLVTASRSVEQGKANNVGIAAMEAKIIEEVLPILDVLIVEKTLSKT